ALMQEKDIHIADFIITENRDFVDDFEESLQAFNELVEELEPSIVKEDQQGLFNLIKENDAEINGVFYEIIESDNIKGNMTAARRDKANGLKVTSEHSVDMLIESIYDEQAETMESASNSMRYSLITLV